MSTLDTYTKVRVIGKGSYGEVWLVKHRRDKKQYVLKKMNLQNASKRERKAAEQEAKLLAKLKHPNIVSYKDSFEADDGFLYIGMGYCEGGDLYSKLKEQKGVPLEERQVVEWFVQIAMALQYMHERNILHRDLKTQNIFLTKSKIIKVGDLGIARVLDSSSDMATTLIGTPYYMSPELFSNKPYNHKSDVWALGCCVYEMATLKHAFNAKDMNSLVYKILRGKMPAMPKSYSSDLCNLIKAMMSQTADKRPSVNRILRDPYIKKNIAIFLEGTKRSRRPSTGSVSSRPGTAGSRRSSQSSDPGDAAVESSRSAVSSAASVAKACEQPLQALDMMGEPLELLQVGPDLQPIKEESLHGSGESKASSHSCNSNCQLIAPQKDQDVYPSARGDAQSRLAMKKRKRRHKSSEGEGDQVDLLDGQREPIPEEKPPRPSSSGSNRSVFHYAKPVEKPRPLPPRPSSSDRPLPSRPTNAEGPKSSEAVPNKSKSNRMPQIHESGYASSSVSGSAEKSSDDAMRGGGGISSRDSARDPDDTPRQSVNLSARERRRQRKEGETPRTARSVDIDQRRRASVESNPGHWRSVDSGPKGLLEVDGANLRPKSAGAISNGRRLRDAESAGQKAVRQQVVKQPSLADSSSSSSSGSDVEMEQPTREKVKQKEKRRLPEVPHLIPKPISSSSSTKQPMGRDVVLPPNRVDHLGRGVARASSPASRLGRDGIRAHSPAEHKGIGLRHSPCPGSDDTGEEEEMDEQKRKDKEMNNFISLLDHTLHMNNVATEEKSESEKEEDDDNDIVTADRSGGATYVKPAGSGRVDSPVIEMPDEPTLLPPRVRQLQRAEPARHVPAKTLGTSTRLMDRISVLRKDCIRALGVGKLKRAYDILDNIEGDELETELVKVLGRNDFDIFAGKIWQLKFCEEAAFGLV